MLLFYIRQTPLHQACIQGLQTAAILMIQRGARLDVRDYYNRTPLEAARDLGHPKMVGPLLKAANAQQKQSGNILGQKKMYSAGDD